MSTKGVQHGGKSENSFVTWQMTVIEEHAVIIWNINIEWKKNYNPTNIGMSYKSIQYLFRVTRSHDKKAFETIAAISNLNIYVKSNIYIIYSNYTFNIK